MKPVRIGPAVAGVTTNLGIAALFAQQSSESGARILTFAHLGLDRVRFVAEPLILNGLGRGDATLHRPAGRAVNWAGIGQSDLGQRTDGV